MRIWKFSLLNLADTWLRESYCNLQWRWLHHWRYPEVWYNILHWSLPPSLMVTNTDVPVKNNTVHFYVTDKLDKLKHRHHFWRYSHRWRVSSQTSTVPHYKQLEPEVQNVPTCICNSFKTIRAMITIGTWLSYILYGTNSKNPPSFKYNDRETIHTLHLYNSLRQKNGNDVWSSWSEHNFFPYKMYGLHNKFCQKSS